MRSTRSVVGFGIAVSVIMLLSAPASAHQYQGTVQFTCTTFKAAGTGADILNRDNTGTGQERLRIDVTDGNGVTLFTLTFQNALGTYTGGLISTTAYTTPTTGNPITMTVTSLAGNGLLQQVDTVRAGACGQPSDIPTLGTSGLIALGGLLAAAAIWLLSRRR